MVRLLAEYVWHPLLHTRMCEGHRHPSRDQCRSSLRVNDPLVAEVFHLLNERLSNLPRHMYARTAEIRLAVEKMKLVLRIANDNLKGEGAPAFCTVRNYGTRRDPSQSCRRGATGSFRNCCHGPNSLLGVFVCMPPT
jgi:hypothetical protein